MPVWNAARAVKIARLTLFSSNPVSAVLRPLSIPCWVVTTVSVAAVLNPLARQPINAADAVVDKIFH
jgi:hypothetical protein